MNLTIASRDHDIGTTADVRCGQPQFGDRRITRRCRDREAGGGRSDRGQQQTPSHRADLQFVLQHFDATHRGFIDRILDIDHDIQDVAIGFRIELRDSDDNRRVTIDRVHGDLECGWAGQSANETGHIRHGGQLQLAVRQRCGLSIAKTKLGHSRSAVGRGDRQGAGISDATKRKAITTGHGLNACTQAGGDEHGIDIVCQIGGGGIGCGQSFSDRHFDRRTAIHAQREDGIIRQLTVDGLHVSRWHDH